MTSNLLMGALLGIGATAVLDAWSFFLRNGLNVATLNYALVGRWLLNLASGDFEVAPIASKASVKGEIALGWFMHYLIGALFGVGFIVLVGGTWLQAPDVLSAIMFGICTVLIPFFVMQPGMGAGIAASKTPNPRKARLLSMSSHTIFGLGIYLCALLLAI